MQSNCPKFGRRQFLALGSAATVGGLLLPRKAEASLEHCRRWVSKAHEFYRRYFVIDGPPPNRFLMAALERRHASGNGNETTPGGQTA